MLDAVAVKISLNWYCMSSWTSTAPEQYSSHVLHSMATTQYSLLSILQLIAVMSSIVAAQTQYSARLFACWNSFAEFPFTRMTEQMHVCCSNYTGRKRFAAGIRKSLGYWGQPVLLSLLNTSCREPSSFSNASSISAAFTFRGGRNLTHSRAPAGASASFA